MADTKLTGLTENIAPISTDLLYMVDDPGGTPLSQKLTVGNLLEGIWDIIQAAQLTNEIKGWPPVVNTGDLDALNLWWDKVGTPTTAPSVVAVSGEGITETWELAMKVVTDAASEGMSQTWTYADEPRLKAGRVMSVLVAIWSVSAIEVTAKLVNSDASHTDASAVTAAAWTIVEIPNHTLAGTTCALTITAGAAGTFYVVPLGANIGSRGVPLPARPSRRIENGDVTLINGVDPGGNWTDVDVTANTGNLAHRIEIYGLYSNGSTANKDLCIRRNGSSVGRTYSGVCRGITTSATGFGRGMVDLDDGQIFEYTGSVTAADTETIYIFLVAWWEWA